MGENSEDRNLRIVSGAASINRTPKRLQAAAMALSTLFGPIGVLGDSWLVRHDVYEMLFFVLLYCAVLISVVTTVIRYRREQRESLPAWRRIPYQTALTLLLLLCLAPLVTWPLALSGKAPPPLSRPDPLFLSLFVPNVVATMLIWFGRGWARIGLAVVSFWILFLWAFPIGVGA
jgi:hypothetical protein